MTAPFALSPALVAAIDSEWIRDGVFFVLTTIVTVLCTRASIKKNTTPPRAGEGTTIVGDGNTNIEGEPS